METTDIQTHIGLVTDRRVYVACLAAYNNGILHGAWCDAVDVDELQENIDRIIASSPIVGAEEWAIHDIEGFGRLFVSENPNLRTLCAVGEWLEDADDADAIIAYLENGSCDIDDVDGAKESFEEFYVGEVDLDDYAEELFHEVYNVPEEISSYIDYKAFARDLRLGGDYYQLGPYLFRSC